MFRFLHGLANASICLLLFSPFAVAQTASLRLTELYPNAGNSQQFTGSGTITLDAFNPANHGVIENHGVIILQCLTAANGAWPSFYDRWDAASDCYANASGCLDDRNLRGVSVRSKVLYHHRFATNEASKAIPFSLAFTVPRNALRCRIVFQSARTYQNPPWQHSEQRFNWQLIQEWSRERPVEVRKPTAPPPTVVRTPPAEKKPEPAIVAEPPGKTVPPPPKPTLVKFIGAQVNPKTLSVDLSFRAASAGSLLSASISTLDNPQPFQQVRFLVGNGGKSTVNFRSKPTGWDPVNHRIRVLQNGKEIGMRVIDFSNLNKSGNTKLAF